MKLSQAGWIAIFVSMVCMSAAVVSADEEGRTVTDRETDERTEYIEVNESALPTANTIATKLPLSTSLTPSNVGTVTSALFREQDAFVLGDALRNVSGLNVQQGSGVHDYFLLRGFDSLNGALLLTDGAQEPEVTFYPMYNVRHIEVLKGPAGFLYGSQPLAGAVNIVRKQPLPTNFSSFESSYGSFGTAQGSVDWNASTEDGSMSFRVNGLLRESDGYRDGRESRHWAVNPSLTFHLSRRSSLNVNLEYVDAEYTPDSGLPLLNNQIPDVPRERSYQSPFDFSDQNVVRFQVDFESKISDRVTIRNKSYYRDLDWKTNGTLFNACPPVFAGGPVGFANPVCRTLTLLDDRQKYFGNQLEAIVEFDTGPVRHNLLAGLAVERQDDDYTLDVGGLNPIELFAPRETTQFPDLTSPLSPSRRSRRADDTQVDVIAPYVVDQLELSSQFQLLLGLRLDRIELDGDCIGDCDGSPLTPSVAQPTTNSRSDSELSPMAGIVYSPLASLALYANAGQAFAPASPRIAGPRRPEESTQFELGAKKSFLGGKIKTTLAGYQIERDNIAIPDATGFTQQTGDQRSRGVELEIAAEPQPGMRAFLAYAYNDSELTRFSEQEFSFATFSNVTRDRTGNTPAFAPRHLVNFWVGKTFQNGLGIGGGGRYFSKQFIDEDNRFAIGGALILDGTVFYDYKQLRFKLNLKNLADKEYETRGFQAESVIPAPGFAAQAAIEIRL